MYCKHCGKEIEDQAAFCAHCGSKVNATEQTTKPHASGMHCPNCGSGNVEVTVHQENTGGNTVTKTKSKYRQKGHGCLWWLFIGSWWWMVDLMLWICIFPLRFLFQLFRKKKYVGESTTVSSTSNNVNYKSVCLCKDCGHHWSK